MYGKTVLQSLNAYKQGMQIEEVKKAFNLSDIVKLSSNENPYGHSELVDEIFLKKDFELYPDGYSYYLRETMANKLQVKHDQLVFGAGSDELITCICRAFLYEGTNTVMATPTFSQYRHHSLVEGAELKEVPTVNGRHSLDEMAKAIDEQTKVVWLCRPDNPTGTIFSQEAFESFMKQCPREVIIVLDEAYIEYMDDIEQFDLHQILKLYSNVIVLRTFSKIYGLAGLRIGYGIMHEEIAHLLNVVRGPFNTSSIAQRAATVAIKDDAFIERCQSKNKAVLTSFQQFLTSINWDYYDSHTNFLLVNTPIKADDFTEYLLEKGYIVRSGDALGYPNTVRITIGKEKDMKVLQEIIAEFNDN